MPYQLNRYNRQPLVTVDDGATDSTVSSLTFVGKNFAGYGTIQNENFLYLLENFANGTEPSNAIAGQIWYDSASKRLKFYDPTISGTDKWRTTGGSYVGASSPSNLNTGDFWFDTSAKQLQVWNGTGYTLVGPQSVSGSNQTNLESIAVKDTDGNSHAVVTAWADGVIVFIISKDTFTLDNAINPITGFSAIKQGITLINSATGSTSTSYRFWGTATDSDKLGGHSASEYSLKASAVFTSQASFPDAGLTVGNANDIKIFMDSGVATIENTVSSTLSFKVKKTGGYDTPLALSGTSVLPGLTDTQNLGSATFRWNNVYTKNVVADTITATNFVGSIVGVAAQTDSLKYNGDYRSATELSVGNSIVARDASGDFAAHVITAIATQARYADLAEVYESDDHYDAGTVVVFGGEKEITTSDTYEDTRVAGIISTNPAYLMNNEAEGLPVALRGKVPCKVVGPVNKGDVLVTSTVPGYAKAGNIHSPAASIVGKSLEDKITLDQGVVMVVVV